MTAPAPVQTPQAEGPFQAWRLLLIAAVLVLIGVVYAMGWHRQLSLETLVAHRAAIDGFLGEHRLASLAIFVALYIAAVALSIPSSLVLTISGGILFGIVVGALASIVGATIGATIVFLIAKSAIGERLVRRAGPLAVKLADGFRANAFNYLLFLRLVPVFPFWLVNLAPALFGVRLGTYVAATALGILPAAFAFAFFGAGLDSAIAAQETAYRACLAAGRADCRLDFELGQAATPELLAALVALGVVALIPVLLKRLRARRRTMG